MKKYEVSFSMGMSLSLCVGFWHFFVPTLFQWYSYIPSQYENLIVGIDWTNSCFSVLLFGLSLVLLSWKKRIFELNKEALTIYSLLTGVWVFRVIIAIINPWPLQPIKWVAYGQFAGACLIVCLLGGPLIKLLCLKKSRDQS